MAVRIRLEPVPSPCTSPRQNQRASDPPRSMLVLSLDIETAVPVIENGNAPIFSPNTVN